jgi:hypothetical protein
LLISIGFFLTSATLYAQSNKELIAQGQYLFAIAGGCACHTVPKETYHAGGRAFPIPFGTVFSTNITSDKETGLGDWSERQIHDAMNAGKRRDGSRLVPVMPYEAYSGMAQEDLKALIAYMRTLKPVKKAPPDLRKRLRAGLNVGVTWLVMSLFAATATHPGTRSAFKSVRSILPAPGLRTAPSERRYRTLRLTKKQGSAIGNGKILPSY